MILENYQKYFMEIFCETIEIRQVNSLTKNEWRWIRVQCSVIYDSDHNPIKTIGVLKDITEDKLNQKA